MFIAVLFMLDTDSNNPNVQNHVSGKHPGTCIQWNIMYQLTRKTLGAATAYVILNHKSEQKKPDMHTV